MSEDLFSNLPREESPDAARADSRLPYGEARFVVTRKDNQVSATIRASDTLVRGVAAQYHEGEEPEPRTALQMDFDAQTIRIFPQLIYFSDRLYGQKYRSVREIQIPLPEYTDIPDGHFGVVDVMQGILMGFIKDPSFGLGLVKEMRPLISSVEKIKGVTRLVLALNERTRVEGDTFYLELEEYNALRSGMNRIARVHQAESLVEREIMAHNASIHLAEPGQFEFKERPYKPGTVFKLLGGSKSSVISLRGKDRLGLINALASNAESIARRDPKEFVQLQKDIEVVSLDRLIASFEANMRCNSIESAWQRLLELNPFLLSMLFGQPIVILRPSASVGGQTLGGGGTKIADFLAANPLTHNAALVEIKRPKTPLLGSEYRGGVYPPSRELMGSVTQVLDQRLKLLTNIAQTRYNSKINDLDVSAVECVVVAGRTPPTEAAIASFELVRSQFKDVRVITFDELLERLELLRELLTGERYVSELDEEGDQDWDDNFESDEGDGWEEPDDHDRDPPN